MGLDKLKSIFNEGVGSKTVNYFKNYIIKMMIVMDHTQIKWEFTDSIPTKKISCFSWASY